MKGTVKAPDYAQIAEAKRLKEQEEALKLNNMEKEKSNTAIQQEVDVTEEEWADAEWKRLEKEREEEERVQINAETSRIKEEKELNAIVLEHEKLEKQKTVEPAQTKMKVNSNIMNNMQVITPYVK